MNDCHRMFVRVKLHGSLNNFHISAPLQWKGMILLDLQVALYIAWVYFQAMNIRLDLYSKTLDINHMALQ